MHKRKVTFYANILIILSTIFIFVGIFLEFSSYNNVYLVNEVDIDEEEQVVSITPVDGNEIITDSSTTIENSDNLDTSIQSKSVGTIEEVIDSNDKLRKEIEKDYNIKIYYGEETSNYTVQDITTYPINDKDVITNQLNRLKNTLALYPKELFLEIKKGGIPLSIYLINNYSENSVTGVTDSSYNYAIISVAAVYPLEESFYHESYHYIERYMFKVGARFSSWGALNPEGFSYGSIYNKYSYVNTFLDTAPFVNNYSQTSDAEDRASTFEYMMANSKASCLNNGNVVWKKASYMARTMDVVLNTVSPDVIEYWERFL